MKNGRYTEVWWSITDEENESTHIHLITGKQSGSKHSELVLFSFLCHIYLIWLWILAPEKIQTFLNTFSLEFNKSWKASGNHASHLRIQYLPLENYFLGNCRRLHEESLPALKRQHLAYIIYMVLLSSYNLVSFIHTICIYRFW